MMTAVSEVNSDEAKVQDVFFSHGVSLVCFAAELDV